MRQPVLAGEPDELAQAGALVESQVEAALATIAVPSLRLLQLADDAADGLATALHEAAGRADDRRWHVAHARLDAFVAGCQRELPPRDGEPVELGALRAFLRENADLSDG
ncbi:MAG: hypothetical protein ACREM6_09205 [Vulcanimicrobiaceae bacterium]